MQHGRIWRRVKPYTAAANVPFNLSYANRYTVTQLLFDYGLGLQLAPTIITAAAQNGANRLDWGWNISFKIGIIQFNGFFEVFPAFIEPTNLWELALVDTFGNTMGAIWRQEALLMPTDGQVGTVIANGPISFHFNGSFHDLVPQWRLVPLNYHDEP